LDGDFDFDAGDSAEFAAAADSVKCHFWVTNGACRSGYSCPWRHSYVTEYPARENSQGKRFLSQRIMQGTAAFTPDPGNLTQTKQKLKPALAGYASTAQSTAETVDANSLVGE
jgi:hypothetical protein